MPNDRDKRRSLIDFCNRFARSHGSELPAVPVEQFFDGNDDLGSIMCNLSPSGLGKIRDQLLSIRARPDVQDVLVRIQETMEDDDESWPFAEQVLIITSAKADHISAWFHKSMAPDEVSEMDEALDGVPAPSPGSRVLVAWWD